MSNYSSKKNTMKIWNLLIVATVIPLTGCQTVSGISDYCAQRPGVCLVMGAVIAGGALALTKHKHHHQEDFSIFPIPIPMVPQ